MTNETSILEKIVELDGDCLRADICRVCPFRSDCLPNFLMVSTRYSKMERVDKAMVVMMRTEIMGDV